MNKKKWIRLKDVKAHCDELAAAAADFQPEAIVSIESGGWYVGHCLEQKLMVPHYSITIRRKMDLEALYARFPKELALIPKLVHTVLFLVKKPEMHGRLSERSEALLEGKRVLVVDDAAQSGRTLGIAVRYLQKISACAVRTAVVSSVFGKNRADYCCRTGLNYFPWSKSSRDYRTYLELRTQLAPQP